MKLSDAVQGFLLTIAGDGFSEATIRNYSGQLGRMVNHLQDPEVGAVNTQDLRSFLSHVRHTPYPLPNGSTRKVKEATIYAYWKAIRSFYGWADNELNLGRPDKPIPTPQVTKTEITPFTQSEVKALLKACECTKEASTTVRRGFAMKRPTRFRDRALVLLLLDTGVRVSECARLQIKNINLSTGEISIEPFGSGMKSKSRHVYMGKSCRSAVWKYLTTRKDAQKDEPLFLSTKGMGMDRYAIKGILGGLGDRADVPNVHPHRFRHTFAIQALRNGTDIFTLQRMLGHSSLEMVRYYLTLVDTDSAEAHRKSSPVDRWLL